MRRLQVSNWTAIGRHPEIFALLARLVRRYNGHEPARILSFGCSTGEEPYTLATQYLADCEILAVDVDRAALALAKERHAHPRISYQLAELETLGARAPFQVVFAMSVFCRWPDSSELDDISALFPFHKFLLYASALAEMVAPGGYLVIYNANYDFADLPVMRRFEAVRDATVIDGGFVKRFAPSGRALDAVPRDCIYRRIG